LALERGEGGVLHAPSAYFCKHPPVQYPDDEAYHMLESFISKNWAAEKEVYQFQNSQT
jgi:myo-inositol-1-phosphate synthase